jgi:hypothetical protein
MAGGLKFILNNIIYKPPFNKTETFHQHVGLIFKEETNEKLHMEKSCVWC